MNPYLLCLSAYALLILPLTLRFRLRLGKRSGYRFRVQAAGLPFVRRRTTDDRRDERPLREKTVATTLAAVDPALLRACLSPTVISRALRAVRVEALRLDARFDFADARRTAVWYAALSTALRTAALTGALPPRFSAGLTAGFAGSGTELLFQGILTLRLGSLLPAAAGFAKAYLRAARKKSARGIAGGSAPDARPR